MSHRQSRLVLRCWARRDGETAFCAKDHGHLWNHARPTTPGYFGRWDEAGCARDAGAEGRETAALRILELSHEADRLAFVANIESVWPGFLRAIAARLHANTDAVGADLASLRSDIGQGERIIGPDAGPCDFSDPRLAFMRDQMTLLVATLEILKSFAGHR